MFFFKAVRGVAESFLRSMLDEAWKESPIDCVKLIFHTRDCRGGKGEKLIFAQSLKWLAEKHPETLQKNLALIPFFGSWKDILSLCTTKFEDDALNMYAKQLEADLNVIGLSLTKDGKEEEDKLVEKMEVVDLKNKGVSISLAAKWAPTEDHKDDTATQVAKKLAKKLLPKSRQKLKDYRKKVLVPLRKKIMVTETFMTENKWNAIPYTGVASRCMNNNKKAFQKHDGDRFTKYLQDVALGKTTIKGGQLFPHELAKQYFTKSVEDPVAELQWKVIIEEVKKNGSLKDAIVVSDVSGSMSGTPMEVSVAMGILISQVAEEPFHNVVISFHDKPTFHVLPDGSLKDRVKSLQKAPWGGSTNFQAVFDLILERAKAFKLAPEAMPKKLFVISDMQFDQADMNGGFKTNYQVIKKKYQSAGYPMPTIVFWNVRANTPDFPVTIGINNTALISGYSPSILKVLMEKGAELDMQIEKKKEEKIDPYTVMRKAIDDERYSKLSL